MVIDCAARLSFLASQDTLASMGFTVSWWNTLLATTPSFPAQNLPDFLAFG